MGPSTRSVTELDTELEYRNDDGRPDSGAFYQFCSTPAC